MIRDGLWGPPFLCAGGWFMVGFDSYVPLVNGGGVGGWLWPVGHSPPPTPPPPGAPGVRGGGWG